MPSSRLGCPLSLKTPNMGNPGLEDQERTMEQIDRKVEEILRSPIGCEFLLSVEASGLSPVEVGIPRNSHWLAAGAVEKLDWWGADHAETVADALEHGERLRILARTVLEHPSTAWWFASLDREHQVWISHDNGPPNSASWQRPNSPPDSWERYAQKPRTRQYQYTSTMVGDDTSLFVAVDYGVGDFNLWSRPFECWELLVPNDVQVFEIHGPADWNRLCVRYRARGQTDGPPDPEWLVPDWGAAAEDWDGVHLSLGGLLTAEQVGYQSEDGISMLNFWQVERTSWLRGFVSNAHRLPDHGGRSCPDHIEIPDPNPGRRKGVPLRRID